MQLRDSRGYSGEGSCVKPRCPSLVWQLPPPPLPLNPLGLEVAGNAEEGEDVGGISS